MKRKSSRESSRQGLRAIDWKPARQERTAKNTDEPHTESLKPVGYAVCRVKAMKRSGVNMPDNLGGTAVIRPSGTRGVFYFSEVNELVSI